MKRRWALRFVLLVGAAMAAVALVLRTSWAGDQICEVGGQVLGRLIHQEVELVACTIEPLASRLVIGGVRLGPESRPVFAADRLLVELAPLAFGKRIAIERVEVDRPRLDLALQASEGDDEEPSGGDCLGFLQKVRVDHLQIRDASAIVHLPDGGSARVGSLQVDLERERSAYLGDVALREGAFLSGAREIPVDEVDARIRLDSHGERLDIHRLQLAGAGVQANLHGSIDPICKPQVALQATIDAALEPLAAALAPDLEGVEGSARIEASLRGGLDAPQAQTQVTLHSVALGEFPLGDLELQAGLRDGVVELEELIWPVEEGRAIVRGEVRLEPGLPTTASVRTEALDFERLLVRLSIENTPVQMAIDSEHQISGMLAGEQGLHLTGESQLTLRGFHVDNAPWHDPAGERIVEIDGPATLRTRMRLTSDGIRLEGARAAYGPGTTIDIDARLGFSEMSGMSIRASSPRFDLAHLRSHVAGIPVGGVGMIAARIEGPYSDPLIEGELDLEQGRLYSARLGKVRSQARSQPAEGRLDFIDVEGHEGSTGWQAQVSLDLGDEPHLEAEGRLLPGGRLGDLFAATADLVEPLAWLRDNLDGRVVRAEARVSGHLPDIQAEGTFLAQGASFLDRPFDELEVELQVPGIEELRIESAELRRGEGHVRGSGVIRFPEAGEPSVDSTLVARDLPLRDLLGDFGEWADLEGKVGARGRLYGPFERLDVSGEVFANNVEAAGVELRPTRLSLETQGDQVIVRGPVAGAGAVSGAVQLAEGLPYEATLHLEVPRLSRFLPEDKRVRGSLQGTATATGTLADITASRGSIDLARLALRIADYRLVSTDRIRMRFDGGAFELEGLGLQGENTELHVEGRRAAGGALDMRAQGSFDARLLTSWLPQIEHPSGVVDIKAALTGTDERPVLVGSADVRSAAFRVKDLPVQVQRLAGRLTFSQNQVLVEDATMLVNQGRARLTGAVSLRNGDLDRFDLSLDGERVSWRMPADWPAVVSGNLHLGGAWPTDLILSGALHVDRLRYARDLDLERMVLDFRQQVSRPPGPDDEEWLRFDVDLIGGTDMRVDNNLLRARLQFVAPPGASSGRLKLTGTNVRIGLLGSVEVLDGIAFFRGNEYRVSHGVVEFDDRYAIDPYFDVTADTSVREYRVDVRAWGRLETEGAEGFQLEFSSEPTLAQADVLTLLTFGITSRDLDRGATPYTGAGVAAEALLTASGLDEHVKRWLPDSEVLRDPEFSVTNQYVEDTGQVEPMATFEARFLSEKLRLQAATPFSTARGRRISTEYRLDENLAGQIVWENEETGYSLGDLGVDIKLRWEWD